jgi:transposase-like protein
MAARPEAYTPGFELRAVKMTTDQHLGVAEVARRLGVPESRLHEGKKAARAKAADALPGSGRRTPTEEETRRPRAEVRRPEVGRDTPKKATPFFAALGT